MRFFKKHFKDYFYKVSYIFTLCDPFGRACIAAQQVDTIAPAKVFFIRNKNLSEVIDK